MQIAVASFLALLLGVFASASPTIPSRLSVAASANEIRSGEPIPQLDAAVTNSRIVLLGEPWHGDGGAIALRAEIVRYLHQRHGFDVLVFEADFFAIHRGWQSVGEDYSVKAFASDNIYSFWSQTTAASSLWNYIEQQRHENVPFDVAGMDTKLVGRFSRELLPEELAARLAQLPTVDPGQAAEAGKILDRLLNPNAQDPADAEEFALLQRLVSLLAAGTYGDDPDSAFWLQMAESLQRNLGGEYRDPGMADNLIWLAENLYPDRKIIVWLHNNHGLIDKWAFYSSSDPLIDKIRSSESPKSLGERSYVGEILRNYFGPHHVYSIATLSYSGEFSQDIYPALYGRNADFSKLVTLRPTGADALETAFVAQGKTRAFVDLRKFDFLPPLANRAMDYTELPELTFDLRRGYDGLLFLQKTHGLNSD